MPNLSILTGTAFADQVESHHKRCHRTMISALHDYILSSNEDRVFLLSGLRRTGKSTMLFNTMETDGIDLSECAYINVSPSNSSFEIRQAISSLERNGIRIFLIDEVTNLADFSDTASLYYDLFTSGGNTRIVLTGTNSLGILFSHEDALFEKSILQKTTRIPFLEYRNLIGIKTIDDYISCGGILFGNETVFNGLEESCFPTGNANRNLIDSERYIETSVSSNISKTIERCGQANFRHLYALHKAGELISAIKRVVEWDQESYLLDALTRDFKARNLEQSNRNLTSRGSRNFPGNFLEIVNEAFRKSEAIFNRNERKIRINSSQADEIREFLTKADLIDWHRVYSLSGRLPDRMLFTQPGLCWSMLMNLVSKTQKYAPCASEERNMLCRNMINCVRGEIFEDIVISETMRMLPEKFIFKYKYAVEEIDIVICDLENDSFEAIEIKHASVMNAGQSKNLRPEAKRSELEMFIGKHFGRPFSANGQAIIYNGESGRGKGDIRYMNSIEYLELLQNMHMEFHEDRFSINKPIINF